MQQILAKCTWCETLEVRREDEFSMSLILKELSVCKGKKDIQEKIKGAMDSIALVKCKRHNSCLHLMAA